MVVKLYFSTYHLIFRLSRDHFLFLLFKSTSTEWNLAKQRLISHVNRKKRNRFKLSVIDLVIWNCFSSRPVKLTGVQTRGWFSRNGPSVSHGLWDCDSFRYHFLKWRALPRLLSNEWQQFWCKWMRGRTKLKFCIFISLHEKEQLKIHLFVSRAQTMSFFNKWVDQLIGNNFTSFLRENANYFYEKGIK